jgi:predicted transcriptional regulator
MEQEEEARRAAREAEIVARRDAGVSWQDIEKEFGLTRQQARYGYQRGKRVERRAARRNST